MKLIRHGAKALKGLGLWTVMDGFAIYRSCYPT
jgi:hypothetical protein